MNRALFSLALACTLCSSCTPQAAAAPLPAQLPDLVLAGNAGQSLPEGLSTKGGTLSGPMCTTAANSAPFRLQYNDEIRWNSTATCNGTTYALLKYTSATTKFSIQSSSGVPPGLTAGGLDCASGSSGDCNFAGSIQGVAAIVTTRNALPAVYCAGTGWFESWGDTAANLYSRVPTANSGASIYDDTNTRWQDYENGQWNARVTVALDGGAKLINPAPATGLQVDSLASSTTGFHAANDRSRYGTMPMFGNGSRFVQLGGGAHFALEQRTLVINPGHESSLCPRCYECTPSTLTALDGQTCTDAAAGGTTVIDTVDFRTFVTAASTGSTSTYTSRVAETRRNQSPHMVFQGMTTATTSRRIWYGLSSVTLGSDTPTGHIAALRYSTDASDTTWKACTGDGSTTSCSDTGVTVTASRLYWLEVDCRHSAGTKCLFTVQRAGLAPVTIEKTTNLPTLTTNMSIRHHCEARTTTATTCGIGPSALETL